MNDMFGPREVLEEAADRWWIFLLTGITWLVFALLVFQWDNTTVYAISILFGVVAVMAGVNEFFAIPVSTTGWRWIHALLGILFILVGIWALWNPYDTFSTLAALVGLFLLLKGVFDIMVAFITKDEFELWWLQLVIGMLEILLAFWVAGNFRKEACFSSSTSGSSRSRAGSARSSSRSSSRASGAGSRRPDASMDRSRAAMYRIDRDAPHGSPPRSSRLGARRRRRRLRRRGGPDRDAGDRRSARRRPRRRRPRPPRRTRPRRRRRRPTTTETETTVTTPVIEGDPAAGKEVFLGASACGGCHTLADAGSTGAVGPNLDDAQPSEELVLDRVTNGQGGMPSFSSTLNEQQIADVAAYVSSVAGS